MLVMYKGWGCFDYELDIDAMNVCTSKEWEIGERWREPEQWVEACAFELPKHNESEIAARGESNVEYLLLSEHSYLDEMELNFPYSNKNDIRFYLCEDEPLNTDGYYLRRKQKTFPYAIGDTFEAPCIGNVPKKMTETELNNILMPPAYLNPNHPTFSLELDIAIKAWIAVLECNPDKPKQGSRKKFIAEWLEKHHSTLTKEAKTRIITLLNPDKNGGAPKSI